MTRPRVRLRWVAALLLLAGGAGGRPAAAQQGGGGRVSERVAGHRPAMDRMAELVQRRLGLSDDQANRLRASTSRHVAQREQLLREERRLRRALREEVARGPAAAQDRVARMLDELVALQRQRLDVLSAEQRDLAQFLTPVQRAEFMAMQERAFRAAQQMRLQREGRTRDAPAERPGAERPGAEWPGA